MPHSPVTVPSAFHAQFSPTFNQGISLPPITNWSIVTSPLPPEAGDSVAVPTQASSLPPADNYDDNQQIARHFTLLPALTPIPRVHFYYPLCSPVRRAIRAIFARFQLTLCSRYGLFFAGNPTEVADQTRDRTMVLVVELKGEELNVWRAIDAELRLLLSRFEMSGLRGVCVRYYEGNSSDRSPEWDQARTSEIQVVWLDQARHILGNPGMPSPFISPRTSIHPSGSIGRHPNILGAGGYSRATGYRSDNVAQSISVLSHDHQGHAPPPYPGPLPMIPGVSNVQPNLGYPEQRFPPVYLPSPDHVYSSANQPFVPILTGYPLPDLASFAVNTSDPAGTTIQQPHRVSRHTSSNASMAVHDRAIAAGPPRYRPGNITTTPTVTDDLAFRVANEEVMPASWPRRERSDADLRQEDGARIHIAGETDEVDFGIGTMTELNLADIE